MSKLSTHYAGIELKNPFIAGSSGLTGSLEKIKELESSGASAIILKSIFEEEIDMEYNNVMKSLAKNESNLEYLDYFDYKIKQNNVEKYEELIKKAKDSVNIPVFASINCTYSHEWSYFAEKAEKAGVDGIELNMFFMPTDFHRDSTEKENAYFQIIDKVTSSVKIPVTLKISHYFTNLGPMIKKLSETQAKGLVLFNRFFDIDIDTDKEEITQSNYLSSPSDMSLPLRWTAIMSKRISKDIATSTGIHNAESAIKMILAGASALQIVSATYKNGPSIIKEMEKGVSEWMDKKGYQSINDFKGKLSQSESHDPSLYERVQFMKYFGEREI